jgi:hypothetical protein
LRVYLNEKVPFLPSGHSPEFGANAVNDRLPVYALIRDAHLDRQSVQSALKDQHQMMDARVLLLQGVTATSPLNIART